MSSETNELLLTPDNIISSVFQIQFIVYFVVSLVVGTVLLKLSDTIHGQNFILIDLGLVGLFGGYTVYISL